MSDQASGWLSAWLRTRRIRAVAPFTAKGNIPDYGCGIGALAGIVGPERYLGLDRDQESIRVARQLYPRHRFEMIGGGAKSLPEFRADAVVALALIEHLERPADWLRSLRPLLAGQGLIILTTPHPQFRGLHGLGGRLGVFSRQAAEEHHAFIDLRKVQALGGEARYHLKLHRRFLWGSNQLFVLEPVR